MRGNLRRLLASRRDLGSIPACAGEPRRSSSRRNCHRVYPRVCGGTAPVCTMPQTRPGLSPRVRGNHTIPSERSGKPRSIPACAGEPGQRSFTRIFSRVYPRVCGGTSTSMSPIACCGGLSPACAGEPHRNSNGDWSYKVYPRVCGGTMVEAMALMVAIGLSPRVRGNPLHGYGEGCLLGSIPACAGEPRLLISRSIYFAVYPRVCGGTPDAPLSCNIPTGSIPACAGEPGKLRRARRSCRVYPRVCGGTGLRCPHQSGASRSIPACAGEPGAGCGSWCPQWVYPRVCGGTRSIFSLTIRGMGLSPRVRGNPHLADGCC